MKQKRIGLFNTNYNRENRAMARTNESGHQKNVENLDILINQGKVWASEPILLTYSFCLTPFRPKVTQAMYRLPHENRPLQQVKA